MAAIGVKDRCRDLAIGRSPLGPGERQRPGLQMAAHWRSVALGCVPALEELASQALAGSLPAEPAFAVPVSLDEQVAWMREELARYLPGVAQR